jgi:hypothetical protein
VVLSFRFLFSCVFFVIYVLVYAIVAIYLYTSSCVSKHDSAEEVAGRVFVFRSGVFANPTRGARDGVLGVIMEILRSCQT